MIKFTKLSLLTLSGILGLLCCKVETIEPTYNHYVNNISYYPITVYNNELLYPKNNFSPVTIQPQSTATIQTKNEDDLVMMFKANDANLKIKTEKLYYRNYNIDAYYNLVLMVLKGNTSSVDINTNLYSNTEQLIQNLQIPTSLPSNVFSEKNLIFNVKRTSPKGYASIALYYKDQLIDEDILDENYSIIRIKFTPSTSDYTSNYDLISIPNSNGANSSSSYSNCGTYNGNKLYRGPKGGCYYINSNGNKTYVDRSFCKC